MGYKDDTEAMEIVVLLFIVLVGVLGAAFGKDSRFDEIEHQRRLWTGVN